MSHKYRLLYEVTRKPEGVARDEVPPNHGACDSLMVASIIYPPDGSFSIAFFGENGVENKPMTDDEMFKAWSMLAAHLAESSTLGQGQRLLCAQVFETIRMAILAARGGN